MLDFLHILAPENIFQRFSEIREPKALHYPRQYSIMCCSSLLYNCILHFSDSLLCNSISFDKTENLNQYNLKMTTAPIVNSVLMYDPNKTAFSRFQGPAYDKVRVLLQHMNATVTAKIHKYLGFTDMNGEPQEFFKDIFFGAADFVPNPMALRFGRYKHIRTKSIICA